MFYPLICGKSVAENGTFCGKTAMAARLTWSAWSAMYTVIKNKTSKTANTTAACDYIHLQSVREYRRDDLILKRYKPINRWFW